MTLKFLEFEIGDKAWIHIGASEDNPLTECTVVHVFTLPDWPAGHVHYVCEVPTGIDPILFVRDGLTMSDAADRPVGLWRNLRN